MLINKEGFKFGNRKHTISYVIAKNKRTKTLTLLGCFIGNCLEIIDKNHLEDSITSYEKDYDKFRTSESTN